MKKKLISTILCVAMAATLLSGCGGKDSGSSEPATSSTEGSAPEESTDAPEGSEEARGVEAVDLEPVTLHFIFYGDKKSATDDVWAAIADYTRDTLNCDYDVQFVAGDDYKQKLTVKAATGDVWDLNFDSDWTGIFQMFANDAYMDLDDLLPAYAPDLYKVYEDAGLLDAMKVKGHIVVLPWTMTMNNRPNLQWRGDLAEAAGITVDKDNFNTMEDVDALLQELKAAYPDKYIIECSQMNGGGWLQLNNDLGFYVNLNDPECKVVAVETTDEYKEMAKYAEKWQSEGIIWKDVLTDKLDHNSLINEGKLITKWGTHEYANSNRAWVEESAYWDYCEIYADDLYANRTPLANTVCISATSENPERTLMFLNMLETDRKLYDMVQYGIEGETYVLNGEEAAYPDGMDGASSNYQGWGGQWALWKPQFMRPTEQYDNGFWEREAEYAASNDKNVVSPLDGFSFDADAVQTEVGLRTEIFSRCKKLIDVGLAGDYEKAIEDMHSESVDAGLDVLLEEYQRQVDEYLASK